MWNVPTPFFPNLVDSVPFRSSLGKPPVAGTGYGRLNRTLSALAQQHPSLVVFDWAALVRAHRDWLRADGVHAGPSGYRARARALAALATRCTASAA